MTLEAKAFTVVARLLQESTTRSEVELRSHDVSSETIRDECLTSDVPTLFVTVPYGVSPADLVDYLYGELCTVGGQRLVAPTDRQQSCSFRSGWCRTKSRPGYRVQDGPLVW